MNEYMDLILNEISIKNEPKTEFEAKQILKNLAIVCAKLKGYGFSKLRTENNFWLQRFYRKVDINSFLQRIGRTQSSFLRSFIRPPYIADDFSSEADDKFVDADYFFNNKKIVGLAYAYLLSTISISLDTNKIWDTHEIKIVEQKGEVRNQVTVKNVTNSNHIENHKEWLEDRKPVILLKTRKNPKDKPIKLRDDHGQDVLQKFAERLIKCEYVTEVINSLPFNPTERDFIRRIYPNGQIEIVLTGTDKGLGMIIQTTGRNKREAEEIGKILQKKYG